MNPTKFYVTSGALKMLLLANHPCDAAIMAFRSYANKYPTWANEISDSIVVSEKGFINKPGHNFDGDLVYDSNQIIYLVFQGNV